MRFQGVVVVSLLREPGAAAPGGRRGASHARRRGGQSNQQWAEGEMAAMLAQSLGWLRKHMIMCVCNRLCSHLV
jgi:hypothetical protein